MKTLTLSNAWIQSIKQWTWIVKQLNAGSQLSVIELKRKWLSTNGYKQIRHDCLLCEYANLQKIYLSSKLCKKCPVRLSHPTLRHYWCQTKSVSWNSLPVAFLTKLKEEYTLYKDSK